MSLTSFAFVVFAVATVVVYNLAPSRYRIALLLAATYVFYAQSSLSDLVILGLVTAVTYGAALVVATHGRRRLLAAAIIAIASPLILFKYSAVTARLAGPLLEAGTLTVADVALPLGISFFTFQAIAYIVDVRRGVARAETRIDVLALYLAFFPKLLAGPVERARDLMPQLRALVPSALPNVYTGLKWALWGFFCKLVVADNIGRIVDVVLRSPQQESGATLTIVFTLYAFEIYFDFLGYTNIAVGVARCFNVRLNPNFERPYTAVSLQEFWRRWHISLSSWFRDYIYVPLGGSTTNGLRRTGQLLLVFLASGLWHGAAFNFLAWGAFHGAAYVAEEQLRRRSRGAGWGTPPAVGMLIRLGQRCLTFVVVVIGWVFFRLSDMSTIGAVLGRMAGVITEVPYGEINTLLTRPDSRWFVLILLTAIALDCSRAFRSALDRIPESPRYIVGELAYVNWLTVTIVLLGDLGVRDFTYFAF